MTSCLKSCSGEAIWTKLFHNPSEKGSIFRSDLVASLKMYEFPVDDDGLTRLWNVLNGQKLHS